MTDFKAAVAIPRFLIVFLVAYFSCAINAQELKISSLIETRDILSADKQRQDANGMPCAVLRIILPEDKASFEGNIVGPSEYKNGEYWVYVSSGTKRVRIKYHIFKSFMLNTAEYSLLEFKSKNDL